MIYPLLMLAAGSDNGGKTVLRRALGGNNWQNSNNRQNGSQGSDFRSGEMDIKAVPSELKGIIEDVVGKLTHQNVVMHLDSMFKGKWDHVLQHKFCLFKF